MFIVSPFPGNNNNWRRQLGIGGLDDRENEPEFNLRTNYNRII